MERRFTKGYTVLFAYTYSKFTDRTYMLNFTDDAPSEAAADADLTILLQQHRTYDLQGLSVKAQLLLDTRGATPTGAAHSRTSPQHGFAP